ncbi:MAG: hypothetical protein KDC71_17995 [Acidobacteria bacterium]|nr:hypothetical protein [Acidobacteriota bacterium]
MKTRIRLKVSENLYTEITETARSLSMTTSGYCRFLAFARYPGTEQLLTTGPFTLSLTLYKEDMDKLTTYCETNRLHLHSYLRAALQYGHTTYGKDPENAHVLSDKGKGITSKRIYLRCSETELETINQKIKASQLPAGRYLALAAMGANIPQADDVKNLRKEWLAVGRNLNQIAIAVHQGRVGEHDTSLSELIDILREKTHEIRMIKCPF